MDDLILRGGTVVDGKRSQPYAADICIREGRIARIAPEGGEEAREVVDVSGLAVAPGFIDIHTHSDACPLVDYEPESKLHQGITTEITGNCGISILPSTPESRDEIGRYFFSQLELPAGSLPQLGVSGLEEYARMVADHGCAANYGQLVGHGTLRGAVMGFVDRDPEPEEMERLKDLLERELRAGAFGMSLGLIYPPSAFCKREELVELAGLAKGRSLAVRFIELMPIGLGKDLSGRSEDELRALLERAYGPLVPFEGHLGSGPSRYVSPPGFQGQIGFISSLSHQFCHRCNRVRLTANGFLKTCLQYDKGVWLRPLLSGSDETLEAAILTAVRDKPAAHQFAQRQVDGGERHIMSQIGG